jgi:adrenodoxin-NADP+ reductase
LENSQIDILERLPTAYGLVRQGVAPDHPEVKNVANDFDKIIEDNDSIHFFGNVTVGKDVNLNELRKIYDIVVLAYGCESDRPFDHLKNSNVKNVMSAREFVAWYNGHVDFEWVGPLVQQALQRSKDGTQHIAVIGHGNVALDCARILAKTREELNDTDIPTRALDVLDNGDLSNQTRSISVVGRRGHVQGAFTIKELRELTKLSKADFFVRQDELDMGRSTPASKQELNDARPRKRIDKLLTDNATLLNTQKSTKKSEVHLRFLLNPIGFKSDDGSCLSGLVCERTRLVGDAGRQTAEGTGKMETLNAQLASSINFVEASTIRNMLTSPFSFLPLQGSGKYWIQRYSNSWLRAMV